jgi:hypothetical protein
LRGVQAELDQRKEKRGQRIIPPVIKSKKPGTLKLDNAKIFEIIPFP